MVIGDNDAIASASVMRQRVENLQAIGIDAEFHLFPNLRHGFGLGIGTSAEGWEKDAVAFWEKIHLPVKMENPTVNNVRGNCRPLSTFAMSVKHINR